MRRLSFMVISSLYLTTLPAFGQSLGIGDPAPKIEIETWVKGQPVELSTGKGKTVYVLEFWATWCPPCVQAVPHLTEVQQRYKDKNVVLVSITDEPAHLVKQFVKRQGDRLNYTVACDKRQKTHAAYMLASGQMGIPTAFIVNRKGQVAWIGSPYAMDRVLEEVVAGRHDVEQAKAQAQAEEKFFRTQYTDLLMAIQNNDWKKCASIGRIIADPNSKLSKSLRSQILHSVAWAMLDHEQADAKYFKEALYLAKAAYEACGCEEATIIDTYARALFDNGETVQAVKYQQMAIDYADEMMRTELRLSLQKYEQAAKTGS